MDLMESPRQAPSLSRRSLLVGFAVLCASALCSCSDAPAETQSVDDTAFGTSFQDALAVMNERVDDAKLIALQCETTTLDGTPTWSYLFGSPKMSFLYSVAPATDEDRENGVETNYAVHTYGRLEWPDKDWEQVPAPETVAVSSAEALQMAVQANDEPVETYSQYLVMYLSGEGSEDSSTTALVWEVLVNAEPADGEEEKPKEDDSDDLTGRCYLVDAVSGELSEKVPEPDDAPADAEADAEAAPGTAASSETNQS